MEKIYTYNVNGEKLFFDEVTNTVALHFQNNLILEKLSSAKSVEADRISQVSSDLLIVPANNKQNILSALNAKEKTGKSEYSILKILRYNGGDWQIPMPKIFAKCKAPISDVEARIQKEVEILSLECLWEQKNIYAFTLCSDADSISIANMLVEDGLCEFASPDFARIKKSSNSSFTKTGTQSSFADTMVQTGSYNINNLQWGLDNNGTYVGVADCDINVREAWGITDGSEEIVVAVLDDGVDSSTVGLVGNVLEGIDVTDGLQPSSFGSPGQHDNHGTACAGIIAATGAGSTGYAGSAPIGVAPKCKILPIRIGYTTIVWDSSTGIGEEVFYGLDSWAYSGMQYAMSRADVLSNSWTFGSHSTPVYIGIERALTEGRNGKGCVVVFASGNNNKNELSFPASLVAYDTSIYPYRFITVGAITPSYERKSPTSSDSETSWGSNYGYGLTVMAPGVLIPTTDCSDNRGYNPNKPIHLSEGGSLVTSDFPSRHFTLWFNGTSAACPHVSGIAALMLSANKNLSSLDVYELIAKTARKVGNYQYTNHYENIGTFNIEMGRGLADAGKAVKYAVLSKSDEYYVEGASYISYPILYSGSYKIKTPPFTASITWSVSDNLTILSGQNSNQIQVAVCSEENPTATITCSIMDFQIEKTIFIGHPPIQAISGPTTLILSSGSSGVTGSYYAYCPYALNNADDPLLYYWKVLRQDGYLLHQDMSDSSTINYKFTSHGLHRIVCSTVSPMSGFEGDSAVIEVYVS